MEYKTVLIETRLLPKLCSGNNFNGKSMNDFPQEFLTNVCFVTSSVRYHNDSCQTFKTPLLSKILIMFEDNILQMFMFFTLF